MDSSRQSKKRKRKQVVAVSEEQEDSESVVVRNNVDNSVSGKDSFSKKSRRKRQKLNNNTTTSSSSSSTSTIVREEPQQQQQSTSTPSVDNQVFQRVQQQKLLKKAKSRKRKSTQVSQSRNQGTSKSQQHQQTNRNEESDEEMSDQQSTLENLLNSLGGYGYMAARAKLSDERIEQLLDDLKEESGEGRNYDAVSELCNFYSISTEQSLTSSRMHEFIPHLVNMLQKEHNFDLMLLSARAITNMIDAMPAFGPSVIKAGALPIFTEKLLNIEFIDLAEQCIQCLFLLSNDQSLSMLKEGILMASLTFVDFFGIDIQRKIAVMAANMCRRIPNNLFSNVECALPNITNFLQSSDMRIVENGCKSLYRIVSCFPNDAEKLDMICNSQVLETCLNLLTNTTTNKPALSSLLNLLAVASRGSFTVFEQLHEKGIAIMLTQLLGMSQEENENTSRAMREHLPEILALLLELLPSREDSSHFVSELPASARRMLLQNMCTPSEYLPTKPTSKDEVNARKKKYLESNPHLLVNFGESMLPMIIEMFRSTHAEVVANRCLTVVGTLLFFSSGQVLKEMLLNIPMSTFLASLLTSTKLVQVATAIQFAEILLERLPDVFKTYIIREGVFHQLKKLSGREINDKRVKLLFDIMKEKTKKAYQQAEKNKKEEEEKKKKELQEKKESEESDQETSTDVAVKLVVPKVKAPEPPATSSLSPQKCDYGTLSSPELASYVVASAQLFQQKFFADERSLDSPVVSKLKELAEEMKGFVAYPDEEEETEVLNKLRHVFISEEGISNFEVISSGIIPAINEYLTALSSGENPYLERLDRVFLFCKMFDAKVESSASPFKLSTSPSFRGSFGSPSMKAIKPEENTFLLELVRKVQLCLTSVENFNLIVSDNQTLLHNIANTINTLMRPLKIKLTEVSGKHSVDISVSPLAEIAAIIEYLKSKPMKEEKESEEEEEKESEEESNESIVSHSTNYFEVDEDEDEEDHRTQTHNVEISNEPKSPSDRYGFLSTVEEKQVKESEDETYRLYINGEALDPHSTIFQALYKSSKRAGAAQHPSTLRLWDTTHAIQYDKGAPLPAVELGASNEEEDQEWVSITKSKRGKQQKVREEKRPLQHASSAVISYPQPDKVSTVKKDLEIHHKLQMFNQVLDGKFKAQLNVKSADEDVVSSLELLHLINFFNLHSEYLPHRQAVVDDQTTHSMLSSKEFINSKLSSKVVRQLQDPYILFTKCMPEWTTALVSSCGYLFSYDTRKLFFHLHFGIARAIKKIQERQLRNENNANVRRNNERFVRIERKKIKLQREPNFLESAFKVIENYADTKSILEFQYEGEEGTGLGPTLEFYTLVSAELQKAGLHIWRDEYMHEESKDPYHDRMVATKTGLFPRPINSSNTENVAKVERIFKFIGKFVARALYDDRIVDLPFSDPLYKAIQGRKLEYSDIKQIDAILFKQLESMKALVQEKRVLEATITNKTDLQKRIEALTLNNDGQTTIDLLYQVFVLPGYPEIELKTGGKDIDVTVWNLEEYIELVSDFIIRRGVEKQILALREGFSQVIPNISMLQFFNNSEMDDMICGCEEKWTVPYLIENTHCDHGYSESSRAVQFFFNILSSMNSTEQRLFLKFVTGCAKLPSGGLKALSPKMTIVLKPVPSDSNLTPDMFLPSVMTCANFIKLPNYSSEQIMRIQLFKAIELGQNSFLLS